ncbi:hypothetical protein BCU70_14330 [Vibrio sp. 10N.286.49.C2]|uniref:DUF2057 family protein n=1 Tax=unclassified Vibrio TaxID=2614977 RepID=UPI000C8329A2|nr:MULTISPECIES: DUF2057 family protein [unclassified Vibrio]PMH38963.1 hypothetical protein BCU70_14330 [Vibrio sp. 10N.286.49.C2]PMH55437.1 hypothetical protein BCU66_10095 [Vibrio sp. 10N.286.49.B1]PMH80929.1 hypothetical protein BCU58_22545 [Vibrio sp. 10N.286.48.B7]
MFRKTAVVLSLFMLGACSSLDSKSDFSQSVESVSSKEGKVVVIGKNYNPITDSINGGDIVKSQVVLALSKKQNAHEHDMTGYVNMEVTYFKSYTEFTDASYDGKTVGLQATKPSTSICTEQCTATQYFSFPVDAATWKAVGEKDFVFNLVTNSSYQVSFRLAAGYIEALKTELDSPVHAAAVATATSAAVIAPSGNNQSVDMIQYWYDKASSNEKDEFVTWAVENRKSIVTELPLDSQSTDMMQYWYKEATISERQSILAWLLSQ